MAYPITAKDRKDIKNYVMRRSYVERYRIKDGEVHIYGRVPSCPNVAWYFEGYVQDVLAVARIDHG